MLRLVRCMSGGGVTVSGGGVTVSGGGVSL